MNKVEIFFHPEATDEYVASYVWYYERGPHLAEAFEHEIERALRLVVDAPDRWPIYIGKYRKILVKRFPFSLVYTNTETGIVVIAVAHGNRKPGYWKKRNKFKH